MTLSLPAKISFLELSNSSPFLTKLFVSPYGITLSPSKPSNSLNAPTELQIAGVPFESDSRGTNPNDSIKLPGQRVKSPDL